MPPSHDQPWWQRYTTELIIVAVGLVVVVGLWVRNRPDDRPSSPDPAVTTTVAPEVTAPPEGEPEDEPAEPVAEGDEDSSLAKAVLRASDLPSGWKAVKVGGTGVAALCEGRDPFARSKPQGSARAAFTTGTSGNAISGTVARFGDDDGAAALLDRIRDDAAACTSAAATYSVSSLRGVGDEALEVTVTVPLGEGQGTLRSLVLVAREGDHVAVISASRAGGAPDEALALRALKTELGRL
jgi:hypothetical protein